MPLFYLYFSVYNMATTAGGSATAPLDQQSTRDSYIPVFDGTPAGYKEWRKRITIYAKKMELTNRKNECVLNVLGSLQGTAWKLVEDFDLENVEVVRLCCSSSLIMMSDYAAWRNMV